MSGTQSTTFYFANWMSDPNLRACSASARGVWMDLICIMGTNKGADYGYLIINGRQPSIEQIARLVGEPVEQLQIWLGELEANGVYSRDKRRAIYCRRMVRAEKSRRNGRLGGNPKLLNGKENSDQLIRTPNLQDSKTQDSLFPEEAKKEASSGPAPPADDPRQRLFDAGRRTLQRIAGMGEDPARALLGRWLRDTGDDAVAVLGAIEDADRNRVAHARSYIAKVLQNNTNGGIDGRRNGNSSEAAARLVERLRSGEVRFAPRPRRPSDVLRGEGEAVAGLLPPE